MFFFLIACVQDITRPYLGDCAQHPDGDYDFGQIGIGRCIAGPADLRFIQDAGTTKLLIANSNPYLNFETGSLLVVEWDSIDRENPTIYSHELNSVAFPILNFSGEIETNGSWITISNRYSDEARDLTSTDRLLQFELENGEITSKEDVIVGSDPQGTAYDTSSGYIYVVNQSSKDISIVDSTLDTMAVIPPWPEQILAEVQYNGSGQFALTQLNALSAEDLGDVEEIPSLADDLFSLTWIEGSTTLWIPEDDSWLRMEYFAPNNYRTSALGAELRPQDNLIVDSISDPVFYGSEMLYADGTSIYSALRSNNGTWDFDPSPLIELNVQNLSGFAYIQEQNDSYIIYAALTEEGWGLYEQDLSTSEIVEILFTEDSPIHDPSLTFDVQSQVWHLTYSVEDEQLGWQIWRATSTDRSTWNFSDSPLLDEPYPNSSAVIHADTAGIHMWYARQGLSGWSYVHSFSADGIHFYEVDTITDVLLDEPQKIALSHNPNLNFRLESESVGTIATIAPCNSYISSTYGWIASAIVGATATESIFGEESAGGISVHSIVENLVYLSIKNAVGKNQIALAHLSEDNSLIPQEVLLSSETNRYAPVVWKEDETFHLLFTERKNEKSTIFHTTSSNGMDWETSSVLIPAQTNDIQANQYHNGEIWVSQEDGDGWNLYTMDLSNATLSSEPILEKGPIGSWDDNGVKDAFVVGIPGRRTVYYSGFDGQNWNIGLAQEEGNTWLRNSNNDEFVPIFSGSGLFYTENIEHFVAIPNSSHYYFSAEQNNVSRVGVASEIETGHIRNKYVLPKTGDTLFFETQKGSDEHKSISLDITINGITLSGNNLSQATIDQERGFLFVSSRQLPYITVIDIRDDGTPEAPDRNYLRPETTLTFIATAGATGFRQTLVHNNLLYAINNSPEGIFVVDLNHIEDNNIHELTQAPPLDILVAPQGSTRDEGANTRASVGPAQMAIRSDGKLLAVSNFNTNSISFYDLTLGIAGTLLYELPLYAENPFALTFSEDDTELVVATYAGEMDGLTVHSTLFIIDTDPTSPTYLQTKTQIKNR